MKTASVLAALFVAVGLILPVAVSLNEGDNENSTSDCMHWFVHFRECPTPSMLSEMECAGAEVLQYYPENTYLISIPGDMVGAILTMRFISSVEPYEAKYKVSPKLAGAGGPVKLRVVLHQDADVAAAEEALRSFGMHIVKTMTKTVKVIRCTGDASRIAEIADMEPVSLIAADPDPVTLMNLITSNTYMGQDAAQALGFRGSGMLAEVQDNGCDADIIVGAGLGHQDLDGVIYSDGTKVEDDHGTCTTGIVFGTGAGDVNAQGIAYQATGAFAYWQTGRATSIANLWNGDFNEGMAGANGIVQSNSWFAGSGTCTGEYTTYSAEIDQAAYNYPRVLTHWAAANSNDGTAEGLISEDSSAKNNICVGAIFHMNTETLTDDQFIIQSAGNTPSRGPSADGRQKPDMLGCFDWIYTVDQVGTAGYSSTSYYDDFGGTSGATPIVAGSSVQAYEMYRENFFGNNPTNAIPYSSTIKALMIADAYQYPLNVSLITRNVQGWGAPDMENMVTLGSTYHVFSEYPQALSGGQSWSRSVYSDGTKPFKTTLCWTDPAAPGTTGSAQALINNLDLKVTSPTGTVYYGNNGLKWNLWSTSGTVANHWSQNASYRDDLNNVENVFIQSPQVGMWTVEVSGRTGDLPQGPQHFSMVASGARLDAFAPTFAGLTSVSNPGLGYALDLAWTSGTDNEGTYPITYNIYRATTSGGQTFATPTATYTPAVSPGQPVSYRDNGPLTPGTTYYYVVRAEDAFGNEDTNTVQRSGTPTDALPPTFAGIRSVTNVGDAISLDLAWDAAMDASPPITYYIYRATSSGGQNFGSPVASTTSLTYRDTPLVTGTTYYYVVRARDSAGREDTNTVERSGTPEALLFFQVQAPFAGYRNLNLDPFEGSVQTSSIQMTAPGDFRMDSGNTGWVSQQYATAQSMAGLWKFRIYGQTSASYSHGFLYAQVRRYSDNALLFQTAPDNEDVASYVGAYHEFYWEHTTGAMTLPANDRFYVQLWLNVTSAYPAQTTYDYSTGAQTNKWAYQIDSNDAPATSINSQIEATPTQYTNVATSNDVRFVTTDPATGDFTSIQCVMYLSQPPSVVSSIGLTFEGLVGRQNTAGNDVNIYAWNFVSSTWTLVGGGEVNTAAPDTTLAYTLSGVTWSNYISGASNEFRWLVQDTLADPGNMVTTSISADYLRAVVNVPATNFTFGYDNAATPSSVHPALTATSAWYPWINITVTQGWNLISVPFVGPTALPGALNDMVNGGAGLVVWSTLQYYNPVTPTNLWRQYNTSWGAALNDLTAVNNQMGVWIFVTSVGDGNICIGGSSYTNGTTTTAIPLTQGWNVVGYPSDNTTYTVANMKAAAGATIVEDYDALGQYRTSVPGDGETLLWGRAYWVYCPSATTWTVWW